MFSGCIFPGRWLEVSDMKKKVAVVKTGYGDITLEFFPEDAPEHVRNFIELAQKEFYNGLTFHRIVPGFVIQGGCPKGDGTGGPGYHVSAEFNSRKHMPGTLAMARAQDPDSAGSQFYICLSELPQLDGQYTVFGQVIDGMNVVQRIGKTVTDARERPVEPVFIEKVTIEEKKGAQENE
jgi:peptidyl-prolyl cis-trans isomerase B (cyclophilin B)